MPRPGEQAKWRDVETGKKEGASRGRESLGKQLARKEGPNETAFQYAEPTLDSTVFATPSPGPEQNTEKA